MRLRSFTTRLDEDLLTKGQVATLFGVSSRTIDNWRAQDLLPCVRLGGRVFFLRSQLQKRLVVLQDLQEEAR